MSRRRRVKVDTGQAISIEDALSIMVVIFVLFFLFIVPLINIDKAKLEQAQQDTYWQILSAWIGSQEINQSAAMPYIHTFGLKGQTVLVTDLDYKRYIEALSNKGDLTVIMHEGSRYISFIVRGHSSVVTYRYGSIHWSSAEREWFTVNNSIDYGEKDFTIEMQDNYRAWTKVNRGF